MQTGKRVLITAAASGIGLAIARGFAAEGAKVHVCDINEDALRALKQSDPSITSTLCDVSDRSSVERLVTDATRTLGGLDVLVNNAGISGPTAPMETIEPDAWEAVLRVNLIGTFNVTRLSVGVRRHHHHVVTGWAGRLSGSQSVCNHEMGSHRSNQDTVDRARPGKHPS